MSEQHFIGEGDKISALGEKESVLKAGISDSKRINVIAAGLAGIAHDARNSLYAIAGGLLLEYEKRKNEGDKSYLRKAANRIDKVASLLADILSMEKETLTAKSPSVQIDSIVRYVSETVASCFEKAGVTLEMYVAIDMPTITASSAGIASVILELLINSLKACEPGDSVRVKAVLEERHILVEVADTARNKTNDNCGRTKTRTSLVETAEKTGSGLGLEIIGWIAREHGSKIEAEKIPGGGSIFRMRLPVVCPEDSEALSNSKEFAG